MSRAEATGIPYDSSLRALADPAAAGDFFRLHQPESTEAWCAEFSRLAYCGDRSLIEASLGHVGFRLRKLFDTRGTEGLLAEGPAFSVLAFRGSDDVRAWITNIDVRPASWRGGGKVHRGFAEALDQVWHDVEAALRRVGTPLILTGHSLGAALATLAASLTPEAALYTFGSPRVGDSAFRAAMARHPVTVRRYVDDRDLVCRVPSARLGYRHVGEPWLIDANGDVAQKGPRDQGIAAMISTIREAADGGSFATRLGRELPREFTDHAPINYVSALR